MKTKALASEDANTTPSHRVVSKRANGSRRVQLIFPENSSKTKKEFMEETDINTIVRRAQITGQLPESKKQPIYGDFSNPTDFQESMHIVIQAQEQFDSLDSEIRDRFSNNPTKFLEFVHNPKNLEEMYRLGLAIKPEPKDEPKPSSPQSTPSNKPEDPTKT